MVKKQWRETYRPVAIDEMVGCPDFRADCEEWLERGEYPAAVLFVGPPGTGKTTAAGVIARQMLGEYYSPLNYIQYNASDDRGIQFIRSTVKRAAQQGGVGVQRKCILFDEADGLTKQAQEAMRNTMENCVDYALFILTANDESAIIPALKSRCMVYRFAPATDQAASELYSRIIEQEGLPEEWLEDTEHLNQVLSGDLRSGMDILQSLKREPNALAEKLAIEQADFSNPAVSYAAGDWSDLAKEMRKIASKGIPRLYVMKQLRENIYSLGLTAEQYYSFIVIWGEFVERVHTWPAGDDAYYDYFIATLKERN
jgi:replication factor C small subunit|tara:strand:- start:4243 stop:5181 length:939 start_codon:yes stop_codon:yes gene_type:complete